MQIARARNLSINVNKTFFMTNGKPRDKLCDSNGSVTLEGTGGVTTMLKSRIMIRVGRIGGCMSSIMGGDSRCMVVMGMDSRGMMMIMIRLKVRVVVTMAIVPTVIVVTMAVIIPKAIIVIRDSTAADHGRRIEGTDTRRGNRDWHGNADTVDDYYGVGIACTEARGKRFRRSLTFACLQRLCEGCCVSSDRIAKRRSRYRKTSEHTLAQQEM